MEKNNIYAKIFSRLEKKLQSIEKKSGMWMFLLIMSGIISLVSYIVWLKINPPKATQDFLSVSAPFTYFSKTALVPFSDVATFWLATDYLKKNLKTKISNSTFLAKASVYSLMTSALFAVFNTKLYIVNFLLNIVTGVIYTSIMYDLIDENLLKKTVVLSTLSRIIISAIGFLLSTSILFALQIG